ncbi:MAG TPA: hypothetical protein VLM17_01050 [Xanthomonadaceae bacterium]|nr:hypothetical protein [Xanthomonadaceae bacterium]
MLRRCLLLAAALAASTACAPLSAQPLVRMTVIDRDSGQWLPEYRHRGERWIAGSPGHRYGVRLTNTTGGRVLVVLSVDGVNAVTGESAAPSQAGYVLDPGESAEIDGWRKSLDDVAAFVFTDLPDSYAARTGRPEDVGVIGIAVFREASPPIAPADDEPSPLAGAARQAAAPAAEAADAMPQRLGTGHGAREWSPVAQTAFERASDTPAQLASVRYDDRAHLVAMGVLPRRWPRRDDAHAPRAFPPGFVPDPPRW